MVGWRRVSVRGCVVLAEIGGRALWVRECLAIVVLDLRSPVTLFVLGAGALSLDVLASAVGLAAVEAADCGREVLSLSIDTGLPAIFDRLCSSGFPVPFLLDAGTLIDVERAMPDFGAAPAVVCGLPPPINAACADALAASLLSGEGERDSPSSSCSTSSLVDCSALGNPNIVMGRCLGGPSSVGDNSPLLVTPEIVPGGSSKLRLFAPSFFGTGDGIGRREGDSSIFAGCFGFNLYYCFCVTPSSSDMTSPPDSVALPSTPMGDP